ESGGAYPHRGGGPEDAGNDTERVAEQGDRRRKESIAECGHDTAERQQDAKPLSRIQPFSRHEPVQSERGQAGRDVQEHRQARCAGTTKPGIDKQEFPCEQRAGNHARLERAVVVEQRRVAYSRPGHQQGRGEDRAKAALHDRGDIHGRELDHDIRETPDEAAEHHRRKGDGIEGFAIHRSRLFHKWIPIRAPSTLTGGKKETAGVAMAVTTVFGHSGTGRCWLTRDSRALPVPGRADAGPDYFIRTRNPQSTRAQIDRTALDWLHRRTTTSTQPSTR